MYDTPLHSLPRRGQLLLAIAYYFSSLRSDFRCVNKYSYVIRGRRGGAVRQTRTKIKANKRVLQRIYKQTISLFSAPIFGFPHLQDFKTSRSLTLDFCDFPVILSLFLGLLDPLIHPNQDTARHIQSRPAMLRNMWRS
ncbi:hypothetical protein M378DRAFT_765648 [Amanita muscaria Koide BX008]|uniref:Uncharacterized protein n=1 Tax=Amanita muscaria (strain Koide BX008) TaxID=946122 RepID=A0A0C2XI22_AMAMK|nr:hypothetical protein M378DRAFT_765648 [Amanita muscaria Koide BX008]